MITIRNSAAEGFSPRPFARNETLRHLARPALPDVHERVFHNEHQQEHELDEAEDTHDFRLVPVPGECHSRITPISDVYIVQSMKLPSCPA